jgi:hypothetical protein
MSAGQSSCFALYTDISEPCRVCARLVAQWYTFFARRDRKQTKRGYFSRTIRQPGLATAGQASYASGEEPLQSNYTTEAVTISQLLGSCQAATGCRLGGGCQRAADSFPVVETTIQTVHAAFLAGDLTCTQLVQAYVQVNAATTPLSGKWEGGGGGEGKGGEGCENVRAVGLSNRIRI